MAKLTQEEILNLYTDTLPLIDGDIDKKDEVKLFHELSKVDWFLDWIDLIVAQDLKNYFAATTDKARDTIRGNINRLIDLKSRCVKSNIQTNSSTSTVKY